MKKGLLGGLLLALTSSTALGQSLDKPRQTFHVERSFPVSADVLWDTAIVDFGGIANFHPRILASDYLEGSLTGELGAERYCNFDESGEQVIHEKIVAFDPEQHTLSVRIFQTDGVPLDIENTIIHTRIIPEGPDRSRFVMDMEYRTAPAFLGGFVKGSLRRDTQDYLIALEHHLRTGESVTVENFAIIRKGYKR
ncbi:MAG: SRPBCC family protein [Myxococcota bacterium]